MKTFFSSAMPVGLLVAVILLPMHHGTSESLLVTEDLLVDSLQVPAGANFSISFVDVGTGRPDYLLEYTPELGPNANWEVVDGATPADLGGGRYQFSVTKPVGFGAYRVMAYDDAAPLEVQFATPAVSLEEKDGVSSVLLTFSKPHTGTINYTISGTAAGGLISPLSGTINVNGQTFARINLQLNDDQQIGELQFLALTLDGDGVGLGAVNQVLITIEENDAIWTGAFVGDGVEFGFAFELFKNAAGYTGNLVSDGNGVIPAGTYPAAVNFTANGFTASVSGITLPGESSLLGSTSTLGLTFDAQAGVEGQIVADDEVRGLAGVSTVYSTKPFLNSSISGEFSLVKTAVNPSTAEVPLD